MGIFHNDTQRKVDARHTRNSCAGATRRTGDCSLEYTLHKRDISKMPFIGHMMIYVLLEFMPPDTFNSDRPNFHCSQSSHLFGRGSTEKKECAYILLRTLLSPIKLFKQNCRKSAMELCEVLLIHSRLPPPRFLDRTQGFVVVTIMNSGALLIFRTCIRHRFTAARLQAARCPGATYATTCGWNGTSGTSCMHMFIKVQIAERARMRGEKAVKNRKLMRK